MRVEREAGHDVPDLVQAEAGRAASEEQQHGADFDRGGARTSCVCAGVATAGASSRARGPQRNREARDGAEAIAHDVFRVTGPTTMTPIGDDRRWRSPSVR